MDMLERADAAVEIIERPRVTMDISRLETIVSRAAVSDMIVDNIRHYAVLIDPKLAEFCLAFNNHNRRLKDDNVDQLARLIREGRWLYNGDTISFCTVGNLLNGQHRLGAIIKADVPVLSLIIFGLNPKAQNTQDDGRKRAAHEQLALSRDDAIASPVTTAALRQIRMMLERKIAVDPVMCSEVADLYDDLPGFGDSITRGNRVRIPGVWPSVLAAVDFIARCSGVEAQAEHFINVLQTGRCASETDPVHHFRERMIRENNATQKTDDGRRRDGLIHAFNNLVNKVEINKFQLPKTTNVELECAPRNWAELSQLARAKFGGTSDQG